MPLGFGGQVGRPPVLVMVAGYSRMIFATMIASRQAPDLIAGSLAAAAALRRGPAGAGVGQRVRGRLVAGQIHTLAERSIVPMGPWRMSSGMAPTPTIARR